MIIAVNSLILCALILFELFIIKQYWVFNLELQSIKTSVERHKANVEDARKRIELLNYPQLDLLAETESEFLLYKQR